MSNIDPCERWSKEDTEKFFAGLQLFGTNFGMIETLFDGKRTRNQIKVSRISFMLTLLKKKSNKEQKKNAAKFNQMLESKITMADYEERFGKIGGQ